MIILDGGALAEDGVSAALLAWARDQRIDVADVLDVAMLSADEAAVLRRSWLPSGMERRWRAIKRPWLLDAFEVLGRQGASGRQLQLLYGVAEASEVSRLRGLLDASAELRRAYESGALSLAHVARLLVLPHDEQRSLVAAVRTRAMSVRQLETKRRSAVGQSLATDPAAGAPMEAFDAEVGAFSEVLSQSLGAEVRIDRAGVDQAPSWGVSVAFYDVESLAGVMERIGRGVAPGAGAGVPPVRRLLRIDGLAAAELDGLVGHLIAES
jgi:hypothetical protein